MPSFPPCKKLRRSLRLGELLKSTKTISDSSGLLENCPTGFFQLLPLEMKFLLFAYLPVKDLSVLTIVSKSLRDLVESYLSTETAQRTTMALSITHSFELTDSQMIQHVEQFQNYGFLLKRLTCLYPTKDRLRVVQMKLQKYLCAEVGCPRPDKCPALRCCGRFMRTFTSGWEDRECVTSFETLSHFVLRKLHSLIRLGPGSNPQIELHVRIFLRHVFLDDSTHDADKSLWLNLVLKPLAMVDQARVLFLLFGPISNGLIQWYDLCEKTPSTKMQTVLCFGELADAFRILHWNSRDWTEDTVISVIDELMCSPGEWLPENVAGQLYLCGDAITVKVLTSKALNGRVSELSAIFLSLCLVCSRQRQSLSWTIDVIRKVCCGVENKRDRKLLLRGIVDAFQTVILDLHDFSNDPETGDTADEDLQNLLTVQGLFVWEILQLSFVDLLGK